MIESSNLSGAIKIGNVQVYEYVVILDVIIQKMSGVMIRKEYVKNMTNKLLIVTVGLPRSGKSTWAREQDLPIVCPDAIRLALHGQAFIPEAENMVWTIAKYMVKSLFLAGHEEVILDATNTMKRRRNEWQSKEWDTQFKIIDTPYLTCIARATKDGREDLIPIITKMNHQFEELEEDEIIYEE
jgi:predicted kinase